MKEILYQNKKEKSPNQSDAHPGNKFQDPSLGSQTQPKTLQSTLHEPFLSNQSQRQPHITSPIQLTTNQKNRKQRKSQKSSKWYKIWIDINIIPFRAKQRLRVRKASHKLENEKKKEVERWEIWSRERKKKAKCKHTMPAQVSQRHYQQTHPPAPPPFPIFLSGPAAQTHYIYSPWAACFWLICIC